APLDTDAALELFDAAFTAGEPALVPIRFDLPALRRVTDPPAVLRSLVRPRERTTNPTTDVREVVLRAVAHVLGHTTAIDPRLPFKDLGFDSLTAVELRNRLTAETGLPLPATLVFDHPTPERLADHVRDRLGATAPDPVLAELDRLKSTLDTATDADHDEIAARLADLLASWTARRGTSEDDLDDVTDSELFDILDDAHRKTQVIRSGEHREAGE
ncbi:MAG: polyketide synthase, partial [Saccharothrix sp.]|nr:polyketide synthase [Saccharothrix sp.]